MSKLGMASFGLRGHGGRDQYIHDLDNPMCSLLAKFHQPGLKTWKKWINDYFGVSDLRWPRRSNLRSSGPPKSRSLSNFRWMNEPWKMTPSMISSTSKLGMASFGLRGHGGWPQYAHDLGTPKASLHAKFHGPRLKTVDLYKEHTEWQTKLVWRLYN